MPSDAREPTEHQPRARTIVRRLLRAPLVVIVWLWFLVDEGVLGLVRPVLAAISRLEIARRIADRIRQLGPYASLAVLAVPLILAEVPKFVALLMISTGHVRAGAVLLVLAYLFGLVALERIFALTRPQLMTIGWFATAYRVVMRVHDWAQRIVTTSPAWHAAREALARVAAAVAPHVARIRRAALELAVRLRRLARGA